MYQAHHNEAFKKTVLISLVLLLAGGVGYGSWYFYQNFGNNEPTTSEIETDQTEQPEETIQTLTYSSENPALEFSYPSSWSIREEDNTVLVESPTFTYETTEGANIDGYLRIYMRQGARDQDSTYLARGIASKPSVSLTYADPSLNQREETSLSFFGLDTSNNFAYFFIAGNFSLNPGQSLGGDYGQDEATYIIGGGYSSAELTDHLATHPVPLDYFDQTDYYTQALEIIKSIRLL